MSGPSSDPTEQRGDEPGRRDEDHDRAQVHRWVNARIARLSIAWLVVWLVTLGFSALAWDRASAPAERAQHQAEQAQRQAAKAQRSAESTKRDAAAAADALVRAKAIADRADARARATERQSRIACRRTRRYSPDLAKAYERFHILSPEKLADYRAGIPRRC